VNLAARELSLTRLQAFRTWLRTGIVDQKRIEALEMIAAIRAHMAAGVTPLTVSYRFRETGYHMVAIR
jgi:hypothetical protein